MIEPPPPGHPHPLPRGIHGLERIARGHRERPPCPGGPVPAQHERIAADPAHDERARGVDRHHVRHLDVVMQVGHRHPGPRVTVEVQGQRVQGSARPVVPDRPHVIRGGGVDRDEPGVDVPAISRERDFCPSGGVAVEDQWPLQPGRIELLPHDPHVVGSHDRHVVEARLTHSDRPRVRCGRRPRRSDEHRHQECHQRDEPHRHTDPGLDPRRLHVAPPLQLQAPESPVVPGRPPSWRIPTSEAPSASTATAVPRSPPSAGSNHVPAQGLPASVEGPEDQGNRGWTATGAAVGRDLPIGSDGHVGDLRRPIAAPGRGPANVTLKREAG